MKTRNLLLVVALLLALGAPVAVSAQEPETVKFPQGFCDNADGVHFGPDHPLPGEEPCPAGSTYDLVNPVKNDGTQVSETLVGLDWKDVGDYEAAIIWAHAPTETTGEAASEVEKGRPLPTAEPTAEAYGVTPQAGAAGELSEDRETRLRRLDPVFRDQGIEAWLKEAGTFTWDSVVIVEARQVDEAKIQGHMTARGHQVRVTNLKVWWPGCVTTDTPGRITEGADSFKYVIDPENGATMYSSHDGSTEANGPVSVWIDCRDWKEMVAASGGETVAPPAAATPTPELTATPIVEVKEATTPTPTATATVAAAAPAATAAPSETEPMAGGGEEESYSQGLAWPFAILFLLIAMVAIVGFIVARRREGRATDRLAELEAELVASRRQTRVAPGDEGPNV